MSLYQTNFTKESFGINVYLVGEHSGGEYSADDSGEND